MSDSPYAKAPDDKLGEIIRLAEARLVAQLTLGIAADQRAMTFASFLAAVEGAIIAGLVALKPDHVIHWSIIAMLVGFSIAAVFALLAASPVAWDIPGGRPAAWLEDIEEGDTLHNGRAAMAGFYDEMIADNNTVLASNANLLRGSLVAVVITLLIAALLALLVG
jgi:hypothetical protein